MLTPEALELMHLTLDGEATPEQQAQLEEILKSPEASAEYEGLRKVTRQLEAIPEVDPPGMRAPILARLRPHPLPFRSRRNIVLALAYAAAAILVVGFLVRRAMPPSNDTAATMASIDEEWPVIARATSADAKITIRQNEDQYAIDATAFAAPFTIEWDASKLLPDSGRATFQKRTTRLDLQRRPGATGVTVIVLRLPDKPGLQATIDLH